MSAPHTGKLVENWKACDEAQIEEEDKVHDDSQTEEVISQTYSRTQGQLSFANK